MTQPLAVTQHGEVGGIDLGGLLAFKGMRYAAPPIGALRFMPPAPLEGWTGVFDATEFGPSCPQPFARPAGWTHEVLEDEDCLRLNVWTPACDGKPRPVMVWLHGGGFLLGSGSWPMYDGAKLSRRGDAVIVTVNHRLGPLGYLHLAEMGGPAYASSGTVGMQDLVACLRWVRDNIAAFGGDPGNVSIVGESGGGAKVCTLLAMPSARGLFHRGVVQSGPGRHLVAPDVATKLATGYVSTLGLAANSSAIDALCKLPVAKLIKAIGSRGLSIGGPVFAPVLDGEVLPRHPSNAIREGLAPDVPLLIGTNLDEASAFLGAEPALQDPSRLSHEELPARLAVFGDRADSVLPSYQKSRPEATAIDLLLAIQTDAWMRVPSIKLAEDRLRGTGKAPVWMYLFCWAAGPLRSAHGFEIPFMFDNIHEPVMKPTPSRQELADRMAEAWLAFCRSGDPNHEGIPRWNAYDTSTRTTMLFDRGTCRTESDPWGSEREAWG